MKKLLAVAFVVFSVQASASERINHYNPNGSISGWTEVRPDGYYNFDRSGKFIGKTVIPNNRQQFNQPSNQQANRLMNPGGGQDPNQILNNQFDRGLARNYPALTPSFDDNGNMNGYNQVQPYGAIVPFSR